MAPLPKCWKDVDDFLFEINVIQRIRSKRGSKRSFVKKVASKIRSNPKHAKWLQAWSKKADLFGAGRSQDDYVTAFIEISWQLHYNNTSEAQKTLRQHRITFSGDQSSPDGNFHGKLPRLQTRDFIGIPSGFANAHGERTDSPLSSIPDEDSNDTNSDRLTPSSFSPNEGARSKSPFSTAPDSKHVLTSQSFSRLHSPNPQDHRRPISPESQHGRNGVLRTNFKQRNVLQQKSSSGHVTRPGCGSRIIHKTEASDDGSPSRKTNTITVRRLRRHNTGMIADQRDIEAQAQRESYGHLSQNDGRNLLAPSQGPMIDVTSSTENPSIVGSKIDASLNQCNLLATAPQQRKKGSKSFSQNKKRIKMKRRTYSDPKITEPLAGHPTPRGSTPSQLTIQNDELSADGRIKPEKVYAHRDMCEVGVRVAGGRGCSSSHSPATIRESNSNNESRTDKGAEVSADHPSNKRPYSEMDEESGNETSDMPRKNCRSPVDPDLDKACAHFQDIEIVDTPLPGSSQLVSNILFRPPERAFYSSTISSSVRESDVPLQKFEPSNSSSAPESDIPLQSFEPPSSISPRSMTPFSFPVRSTGSTQATLFPSLKNIPRNGSSLDDATGPSQPTLAGISPSAQDRLSCYEPPWSRRIDPLSSPSCARGPGEHDTHSWNSPQARSKSCFPLFFPLEQQRRDVTIQMNKQLLPKPPTVWAQSRQELCESLPYFRSYQGGVYSRGKKAIGYLLDGHPAARDIWHAEGKIIISHGGGNSALDKDTKQIMLVNDQTLSSVSCTALVNSYKCGQPIVLIAGNEYNLFPYDLEHRSYVVLGYYQITETWEEPEPSSTSPRGYFVRRKFLFQWINAQGRPWWIHDSVSNEKFSTSIPCSSAPTNRSMMECSTCRYSSPRIYNFGWLCTYSSCPMFFKWAGGGIKAQEIFWPPFLEYREESKKYAATRLQIKPGLPVNLEQHGDRETTSRRFWNGYWCEKCGRLSCREYWTHWECRSCHEKFQVKHRQRLPGDGLLSLGLTKFQVGENAGIESKVKSICTDTFSFKCRIFELPWNRGTIYHIEGNPVTNVSADEIFLQYQRDAEDPAFFQRYCMKSHKLKGRMLSHYFSQNSGASYKYVGGSENTVPLDRYSSVRQAANLIRERASAVLGKDPLFNEILSAAYMVDQKMEFHSDGEKDLGPVVASLSLGAPATMRFRAVPTRLRHTISNASDANVRKTPSIILALTLRHGDVLVMAGTEIQEFYQHAVHPSGFRVAATARYIKT